jgi:hypothetical protein
MSMDSLGQDSKNSTSMRCRRHLGLLPFALTGVYEEALTLFSRIGRFPLALVIDVKPCSISHPQLFPNEAGVR